MRNLASAILVALAAHPGPGRATPPDGVPILVELFTSEGCSSCPPADAALARLLAHPPAGTRVVALGEHVDYWNDLGWPDRFSTPAFTRRQVTYARRFRLTGPYTPQLVVDGAAQVVGSDEPGARAAIAAARARGGSAELRVAGRPPGALDLELRATWGGRPAEVLVALVQDRARTRVEAGENAGRTLEHVAVLRSLTRVGEGEGSFRGSARVPLPPGVDRAVAFVQEAGGGPVRAVAAVELR
jgi:hypothetical protein